MVQTSIQSVIPAREIKDARTVSEHLARLEKLFGVEFSAIEVATGDVIHRASDPPPGDWLARGELSREVARRQTAEVIEERGSVLVIALPLVGMQGTNYVAVAGFVTEPVPTDADVEGLAHAMCVSAAEAADWIARQTPWRADRLLNMAALTAEHDVAGIRAARFEVHVNDLSDNLSQTYEEISLLHRIAGNLNISERNGELLQLALEWLYDLVPAAAVLAYIDGSDGENRGLRGEWLQSNFHAMGRSPINLAQFQELIGEVSLQSGDQTVVLNKGFTQQEGWRFPSIQHLVVVPVSAGDQVWGYLAALNNNEQGDFGTIEASLMSSVATMLAVHIGNIRLYTDQVQLLSGMLQALVSAIDAKDPYTCGHSNRVARVALCLAEQLGCSDKLKNTVYLSGMLHDIGKIGIDDQVLRKPGQLTPEEYDHIKLHPEMGYKILKDITRIKDVLPGVLHHHEAWNGKGYPHGLAGKEIPYLARILAVADAFDAMGSDRSYRKGLPEEKVDAILREGAGKQWDASVIEAFFAARDKVRETSQQEDGPLDIDLRQWA